MALKQKAVIMVVAFCLGIGMFSVLPASNAAAEPDTGTGQTTDTADSSTGSTDGDCDASKGETCCGKVKTSIISNNDICKDNGGSTTTEKSMIWNLLIAVLNIMTAGIGIAAVGGIVYGALLYTTAEDKPDQAKKAIGIITNVVIGLVAYGLMYVLLNFLIPGGIFN